MPRGGTSATARHRTLELHLTEALEQQAATSEILSVIRSARGDVQPVLDAIARSAARLCHAESCPVFRFDGSLLHFEASHGLTRVELHGGTIRVDCAVGKGSTFAFTLPLR